jgi:hypothetical protein
MAIPAPVLAPVVHCRPRRLSPSPTRWLINIGHPYSNMSPVYNINNILFALDFGYLNST